MSKKTREEELREEIEILYGEIEVNREEIIEYSHRIEELEAELYD